jgi:hypothetical protein
MDQTPKQERLSVEQRQLLERPADHLLDRWIEERTMKTSKITEGDESQELHHPLPS